MMTKSLLAAAAAVISSAAFAADLPSKKAPILPPPPPPPAWTGFYLGLNAGYGWSASRDSVFGYSDAVGDGFGALVRGGALPGSVSLSNDAFIGGGQLGYNYQFNANFVAGVEADIQGVATNTATAGYAAGGAYVQATRSLDYLGTVRGRLGYAVVPSLFVYATGGLAYGQANLSQSFYAPGLAPTLFTATSFADTRVGWTAGGGAEWLFSPSWGAKLEYLYYDLGSVTAPQSVYNNGNVSIAAVSSRFDGHVVRAGVNYHFNLFRAPAPVAAKF